MPDQHNAIRFAPELGVAARKALGLDQDESTVRVSESLQVVCDLCATQQHPDWQLLRQVRLASGNGSGGAVAAKFGGTALSNPAGSGIIVVVRRVFFFTAVVMNYSTGVTAYAAISADYATPATALVRDTRWPNLTSTQAKLFTGASAAATTPNEVMTLLGNTSGEFRTEYVLSPGFALLCQAGTVNTGFSAGFVWEERRALPGEL
jgi:hypothetical protein